MSTKSLTFRVTPHEYQAFHTGAEILSLALSQLVQQASVEEAHRLGFFETEDAPVHPTPLWPWGPSRDEESTAERIQVTFTTTNLELIRRASEYVRLPSKKTPTIALFVIGSTLRFLAGKKRNAKLNPQKNTELAFKQTAARLAKLKLPAPFDN